MQDAIISSLSLKEIDTLSPQIREYLNGNSCVSSFENFDIERVKDYVERKIQSYSEEYRKVLAETLVEQHAQFDLSEKQKQHLEAIKQQNSVCITTGHQLNFFGGPVYMIYKILEVVKLAETCAQKHPEYHFIPIFWMASEDHDFKEIQSFYLSDAHFSISAEEGTAVGRIVPKNIPYKEIEQQLEKFPFGEELKTIFTNAYSEGLTLSQSSRQWIQELMKEFGVLILDADDVRLKKLAVPLFKKELESSLVQRTTQNTVDNIKDRFGKVQVTPRACNLFYLNKVRERIDVEGDAFVLKESGRRFRLEEILKELDTHPERFSPNVLLRPVFQETILPNICYVGGNAEVMYWEELEGVFTELDLPKSMLRPRNSFVYLPLSLERIIKDNGINAQDLTISFERFFHEWGKSHLVAASAYEELKSSIEDNFSRFIYSVEKNSPYAVETAEAHRVFTEKILNRLEKKLVHAEKTQHEQKMKSLQRLWEEGMPNGTWQERKINWSVFYGQMGNAWLEDVYQSICVGEPQFHLRKYG